jgi:hypothetical protein
MTPDHVITTSHAHANNEERTSDEGADAGQGMCKSEGAVDTPTLARACQRISDILISVGCGQRSWVDRCSVVEFGPRGRRECHRGSLIRLGECFV